MFKLFFKMTAAAFLLTFVLYVILLKWVINTWDRYNEPMKQMLGKNIIWKQDTLTIVDYSIWDETFILDNDSVLNQNLVNQLEIVKSK
jgi:hypothetical protein